MPEWSYRVYSGAGHTAPLTHPQIMNPILVEILNEAEQPDTHSTLALSFLLPLSGPFSNGYISISFLVHFASISLIVFHS